MECIEQRSRDSKKPWKRSQVERREFDCERMSGKLCETPRASSFPSPVPVPQHMWTLSPINIRCPGYVRPFNSKSQAFDYRVPVTLVTLYLALQSGWGFRASVLIGEGDSIQISRLAVYGNRPMIYGKVLTRLPDLPPSEMR